LVEVGSVVDGEDSDEREKFCYVETSFFFYLVVNVSVRQMLLSPSSNVVSRVNISRLLAVVEDM
jgi:hypothetical protein